MDIQFKKKIIFRDPSFQQLFFSLTKQFLFSKRLQLEYYNFPGCCAQTRNWVSICSFIVYSVKSSLLPPIKQKVSPYKPSLLPFFNKMVQITHKFHSVKTWRNKSFLSNISYSIYLKFEKYLNLLS